MSDLSLQLLGKVLVLYDGQPIQKFRTNKAQALLVYLAIENNEPHQREQILDLLWPGLPLTSARTNLRQVMYQLRTMLPELSAEPDAINKTLFESNNQTVRLNPEARISVDVATFEKHLQAIQHHRHRDILFCDSCFDGLQAATDLYKGVFLESIHLADSNTFEDWLLLKRESLQRQLLSALDQLTKIHIAHQRFTAAETIARRQIEADEFRESAHRQLLEALACNGQRNEALDHYGRLKRQLKSELDIAPSRKTAQLVEEIQKDNLTATTVTANVTMPDGYVDWGEAPDVGTFYGRQREIAQLNGLLLIRRCRLVTILGMGGLGKTVLAAKVTEQTQHEFEYVSWRSVNNAPPINEILADWILLVSDQQSHHLPENTDKRISLLLNYLRQKRCLLVLDNVETVLQAGTHAGQFRDGYEAYGRLIQRIGESRHQSCLMLTSREKPRQLGVLESETGPVSTLQLASIDVEAGQAILQNRGLAGSEAGWTALLARYSGNPLALKLVAETIRQLYGGEIEAFLQEDGSVFGGIWDVLAEQFGRISPLEQEILIWLAIEREAVTVTQLRTNILRVIPQRIWLEAIGNLHRRSLIEQAQKGITVQNVIMQFLADYLIEAIGEELETPPSDYVYLSRFVLLKAKSKEYVRESQRRLHLAPIGHQLFNAFGQKDVETQLKNHLQHLHTTQQHQDSYAASNLLALMLHFNIDVYGYSFSGLSLRQSYLAGASLQGVDLNDADLTDAVFTDTSGAITSLAYSPDGELLAVGMTEGKINVMRSVDNQPIFTLLGHSNWIFALAFSPDSKLLASGSDDLTICIWDAATGRCLRRLIGHTNSVKQVMFSSDGQLLASGSYDHTVRVWDVETGQIIHKIDHPDRSDGVAFSPLGNILATGCEDTFVRLWDVKSGKCLEQLAGHTDEVWEVVFSPDGQTLASSGADHTIRLWEKAASADEATSLSHIELVGHTAGVSDLAFHPSGQLLASCSDDQTVRVWDLPAGECIKTFSEHNDNVYGLSVHPNGHTVASGSLDRTVRLWDVQSGRNIETYSGYSKQVWSLAFSPDCNSLASAGDDNTLCLWNLNEADNQRPVILHGHAEWANAVAFSPNGRTVASGSIDTTIRLWDAQARQPLCVLRGHEQWVMGLAFSPDATLLASSSFDRTVRLWDVANINSTNNSACIVLTGHTNWVRTVAFSPSGRIVASGSDDTTVRLWDVGSGECLRTLNGHQNMVRSVAFSFDGELLASGSFDGTICLWDVATGRLIETITDGGSLIFSVAFHPTKPLLASGSEDRLLRLWDLEDVGAVENRSSIYSLSGIDGWLLAVKFNADGSAVVGGSTDGTIEFWDVETGAHLKTLQRERPYEGMNISGCQGVTKAQIAMLRSLGAVGDSG